jgi:phage gp36-like protein
MSYATYEDLLANFGEQELELVTDRDRDGSPDDGVIDDGLQFADDLINGYLRSRYDLPLSSVPRNIVGIACDIARYRYYQDQPTELVTTRYEQAIAWLRDVANGLIDVLPPTEEIVQQPLAYSTPEPRFTRLVW